jgi:predicted  nucleic acid-binding Zn-ribbon protein
VTSARDLENLTSEIASLHRRQGDLEEVVLEIMERREAADAKVAEAGAARDAAAAEIAELSERKAAAEKEIDAEIAASTSARAAVLRDIAPDLMALYEKLRDQFGGIGAAALTRGQCQGCHLALNTVDLNRIRAAAPDEIIRCEECRRILVRTKESGL